MLKFENLSYSFPEKDLYKNVSFTIERDKHAAFIGTNGSGKSTLINMIMDTDDRYLYDGVLEIADNCRIGYVSQFSEVDKDRDLTVFEYIAEDFTIIQDKISHICTEMETASDIEPLLEAYQDALDSLEAIGGDNYENLINKNLNLANLAAYKDALISNLSGGEFKLIQVIKGMINKPDLLIMDEPDVFLDFSHLNGLKNLINSHEGTMFVITHNRYLLNNCFDKIIHLENMEVQEFDGNYIDYNFNLLATKIELQELAAIDTAEIERNDVLIDRLRDLATENAEAFRGRTLNARVKIQERLEARRIKAPFVDVKVPPITLSTANKLDDEIILKINDLTLGFSEVLLENVNLEIKANDKFCIVGENGTGKTTLLQEIFKNNNKAISIDERVNMAYLSQLKSKSLDDTNTILEEFFQSGFEDSDDIREYIENYGFLPEIATQKIGSLSGGEKNLLQLAKTSLNDANLLLLDEPTSHLDTYSQMALEKAIKEFNGAVIMVSHDFYSIVNCMDYILIIEDKTIRRMNMKKFKKMIYENHFDKDYLELERDKKNLEMQIQLALKNNDFEEAKTFCADLEKIIKLF